MIQNSVYLVRFLIFFLFLHKIKKISYLAIINCHHCKILTREGKTYGGFGFRDQKLQWVSTNAQTFVTQLKKWHNETWNCILKLKIKIDMLFITRNQWVIFLKAQDNPKCPIRTAVLPIPKIHIQFIFASFWYHNT